MAYKDEYEVARLYTDGRFLETAATPASTGDLRLRFHLAPPLLSRRRDPASGQPVKRGFGPWMFQAMRLLARLQRPARHARSIRSAAPKSAAPSAAWSTSTNRRSTRLLGRLDIGRLPVAVQLARLPEQIRGFGHVKAKREQPAHEELLRSSARSAKLRTLRRFGEAK